MRDVCAGVDWAKDSHDVVVEDAGGERLWAATVPHDEAGLSRLCRALVTLEVARVAVERPDGLLVERLLDAGLEVIAMHPNAVAPARPRAKPGAGSCSPSSPHSSRWSSRSACSPPRSRTTCAPIPTDTCSSR